MATGVSDLPAFALEEFLDESLEFAARQTPEVGGELKLLAPEPRFDERDGTREQDRSGEQRAPSGEANKPDRAGTEQDRHSQPPHDVDHNGAEHALDGGKVAHSLEDPVNEKSKPRPFGARQPGDCSHIACIGSEAADLQLGRRLVGNNEPRKRMPIGHRRAPHDRIS